MTWLNVPNDSQCTSSTMSFLYFLSSHPRNCERNEPVLQDDNLKNVILKVTLQRKLKTMNQSSERQVISELWFIAFLKALSYVCNIISVNYV